jgi:hypothetical protein
MKSVPVFQEYVEYGSGNEATAAVQPVNDRDGISK